MTEMTSKKDFEGFQRNKLAARLDSPATKPIAYALFAHCFTCTKETIAAAQISKALAAHNIAVLRFDFTGLGGSEGEFANTNFSSNVQDLVKAADYLRQQHQAPKILIGHSLGGAAILAAAAQIPEALAVTTIAAPSDPEHISHFFKSKLSEIKAKGEAEVDIGGRNFRIQAQFVEDIAKQRLLEIVPKLKKALLVCHSPKDTIVSIEHARYIYDAAKHPKSFISLDNADHLLTHKEDAIYLAGVIAAWAVRYIEKPEQKASQIQLDSGTVSVAETGQGRFSQQIRSGKHELTADEPQSYGGNDTGPSPYEYLLAGLGACTSMTLRLYAEHKKIPLQKVSVTLKHEKIHAEDCEICEAKAGKIDRIERRIKVEGDLDQQQRQKLLEIANKCPVHQTLTSENEIITRLAEE